MKIDFSTVRPPRLYRLRLWLAQKIAPSGTFLIGSQSIEIVGRTIVGLHATQDTLRVLTEARAPR